MSDTEKLVIAISSRALFDLEESHRHFEKEGVDQYAAYQITHENEWLKPGVAFPLVRKLLALNQRSGKPLVEVILLSRNSADTGLRVFNSIQHYQLDISRGAFSSGQSPYTYVHPFGAHLFLSAEPEDVRRALAAGCAAATIVSLPSEKKAGVPAVEVSEQLRIAFDGDAVLFSDESEKIYQTQGLTAFQDNELQQAETPLQAGPFKPFLIRLHRLQQEFSAENCPIRTALVTARSAPAHKRVIKTLRSWNIRIDEAFFLGGLPKAAFLEAFQADFFFDDQPAHCDLAAGSIGTGHVPHGIMNPV